MIKNINEFMKLVGLQVRGLLHISTNLYKQIADYRDLTQAKQIFVFIFIICNVFFISDILRKVSTVMLMLLMCYHGYQKIFA